MQTQTNMHETHGHEPVGSRRWTWVWALAITVAIMSLLFGPVVIVFLGVGLLAGGLWVRHDARSPRDRAMGGGLAAAGAAILLSVVLVMALLMPASSDGSPAPGPDVVGDVQAD